MSTLEAIRRLAKMTTDVGNELSHNTGYGMISGQRWGARRHSSKSSQTLSLEHTTLCIR